MSHHKGRYWAARAANYSNDQHREMTKGEITISHTNLTTIANPLRAFYLDKKKTALIYPRTIIALSMLHRTKLKCLDYVGGGDIYSHREFSIEPFNPSSNPILYLLSAQVPHTIQFGKYGIFLLLHNKGQPRSFRSPFSLRGAVNKMVEFESQITLSGIKPFGPRIPNLPISLVASLCDDDDNSDDNYEYDDDE